MEGPLGEYLKKTNIISITETEIIAEVKSLYFDRLNSSEIVNKLNEFLKGFNVRQSVRFEKENSLKQGKKASSSKKEELIDNPSVKQALNIFGGSIVDVKTV